MREELEKRLQKLAPKFLRDLGGDRMQTCMAFGICCGDGWYCQLKDLFFQIEVLNSRLEKGQLVCDQVKTKYGELCVYWHYEEEGNPVKPLEYIKDNMDRLLDVFEDICSCTCELCGQKYTRKKSYSTLCPDCEELRKKYGVWDKQIPEKENKKQDPEK